MATNPWLLAPNVERLTYLGGCAVIGTFIYLLIRLGVI